MLQNHMVLEDKRERIAELNGEIEYLQIKVGSIATILDAFVEFKMGAARFDIDTSLGEPFETYLCKQLLQTDTELEIKRADLARLEK